LEEFLGILERRLQIVKLGLQFYIFREERAVREERTKHFMQTNQFGRWKCRSLSAKLVLTFVAFEIPNWQISPCFLCARLTAMSAP